MLYNHVFLCKINFIYIFLSLFIFRVSFGSSKGSMVETVVYETPTPVSEYPERFIGYHSSSHHTVPVHQNGNHLYHQPNDTPPNASASTSLNDSGIAEMQQEEWVINEFVWEFLSSTKFSYELRFIVVFLYLCNIWLNNITSTHADK